MRRLQVQSDKRLSSQLSVQDAVVQKMATLELQKQFAKRKAQAEEQRRLEQVKPRPRLPMYKLGRADAVAPSSVAGWDTDEEEEATTPSTASMSARSAFSNEPVALW